MLEKKRGKHNECARDRERERERERKQWKSKSVCERERERERECDGAFLFAVFCESKFEWFKHRGLRVLMKGLLHCERPITWTTKKKTNNFLLWGRVQKLVQLSI